MKILFAQENCILTDTWEREYVQLPMDMDNAAELLSVSDWWWGEALLLLLLPIVEEAALSLYRFLLLDAFFLDLSNIYKSNNEI